MDNKVLTVDSDSEPEFDNKSSTPESDCEENLEPSDEVTSKLKAAGPAGAAAAAAITSVRKSRRQYFFETNPSVRKRQRTRLLRKLNQIINEYSLRVGQQAVVIVAAPGQPSSGYNVFGAKPLKDIVDNMQVTVMQELDSALAQQALSPFREDPTLFALPPLTLDGIPTPLEKMTQAQLRAFIPRMMKFSTGRGKPGWGKESMRPPWWPTEIPWANVRTDARSDYQKEQMSWKQALCLIVKNCYKYHGREDLLQTFNVQETKETEAETDMHTVTNEDQIVNVANPNNQIVTLADGKVEEIQGLETTQSQPMETITDNKNEVFNINPMTDTTLNPNGQIFVMNENQEPILANIHSNNDGTITVTVPKFELSSAPQQLAPDIPYQLILPNSLNEPPQILHLVLDPYDGFKTE